MNIKIASPFYLRIYFFILLLFTGAGCGQEVYTENQHLKAELNALSKEIKFIRTENARLRELSGEKLQIGFEVQIAAFKDFDLAAYTDELVRFHEYQEFEYTKYVLGQFSRYEAAELFLKDIHYMGVKDAFIAGIVDGKRSSIEEAQLAADKYYGNIKDFTAH